jgi:thiamine-monophosphate kinase
MKLSRSARGRTRLGEVGEDALLASLFRKLPGSRELIGDDCAVIEFHGAKNLLVLKTDCVVEKIHFQPATDSELVGWKAMMRPLSDFAAVSGVPQFALITLILPKTRSTSWVKKLYRGLQRAASRFDIAIVGGETSATPGPATISVSVSGFVERNRRMSRSGGKNHDDLFVTGKLGGSLRDKHLRFVPRIKESRWLTENFRVHAMMDLSDGLGADLPRLAEASKLGFRLDTERLPVARGATIDNAIADGEDYEILFSISPRERARLQRAWRRKFRRLPLTRIGSFSQRLNNSTSQLLPRGYVHFK